MPTPPLNQDPASALAQAIGALLRAILDAVFGDVSGLSARHPVRRSHARALVQIERYVAALEAALRAPAAECVEVDVVLPDMTVPGEVCVSGSMRAGWGAVAPPWKPSRKRTGRCR